MGAQKEKPGVMLYWEMFDVLQALPDRQIRQMLAAIQDYGRDQLPPDFSRDSVLAPLWMLIKARLDADHEKYQRAIAQRRLAGQASAAKRKEDASPTLEEMDFEGRRRHWITAMQSGSPQNQFDL